MGVQQHLRTPVTHRLITHTRCRHITCTENCIVQDKNADKARKEARTHVNVGRIVDTARAKMENSRLAFSFLRHITFLCIYSFVVIQQVYTCLYVKYIFMHTHIKTCVCIYYVYIYIYIQKYMYVYIHIYIYVYIHIHTYIYIHIYIYTYI